MLSETFKHEPLDRTTRAFRLLVLKKGAGRTVECELSYSSLDTQLVQYEAVSHTWGPNVHADTISLDGKPFPVTLNVSLILRDLRRSQEDRILWIDAICIDQSSPSERGHQVQQMWDIYRSAYRVLFCIGRPTEMTDLLMVSLTELERQYVVQTDCRGLKRWKKAWGAAQQKLEGKHFSLQHRQVEGLKHMLAQPWFNRAWILPEVANARKALVYCGKRYVSAAVFSTSPRLINVDSHVSKHCQEVLNLMPGQWRERPERGVHSWDLYSLISRFADVEATEERDKIYALLGMSIDHPSSSGTVLRVDYSSSIQDVIRDTISHICHCNMRVDPALPFSTMSQFLDGIKDIHNFTLLRFLRISDATNAHAILSHRAEYIRVVPEMVERASTNKMRESGVMKLLLGCQDARSSLESLAKTGWSPLHWAAAEGYSDITKMVLDCGANADTRCNMHAVTRFHEFMRAHASQHGFRPLELAAMEGHLDVAKILMAHGANPRPATDDPDDVEASPLVQGISKGHESMVRLLLECGVPMKFESGSKDSPLQVAIRSNRESVVRLLLEKGAALECQCYKDESNLKFRPHEDEVPLTMAIKGGNPSMVRLLLEKGANPESPCLMGDTPLIQAVKGGDPIIVRLLVDKGADANWDGYCQATPLLEAARLGLEPVVRVLAQRGARTEARGLHGGTPLYWATRNGFDDVTRTLLKSGANAMAPDFANRTPIWWAARRGSVSMTRLLLECGANIMVRDGSGTSPLDCLKRWERNEEVCELLHRYGIGF